MNSGDMALRIKIYPIKWQTCRPYALPAVDTVIAWVPYYTDNVLGYRPTVDGRHEVGHYGLWPPNSKCLPYGAADMGE